MSSPEPRDLILKTEDNSIYSLGFLILLLPAMVILSVYFGVFRKDYGSMRAGFLGVLFFGAIVFFAIKVRVFAQELCLSKTSLTAKFFKKTEVIQLSEISDLMNKGDSEGDYSIIKLKDGRFIYIPSPKRAKEMLEALSEATGLPVVNKKKGWFT